MKTLISNGDRLIKLCRDMDHDEVIMCIINNDEINNYVSKIANDKDTAQQVMHDTILSFIRSCMKEGFVFNKNPIAYIKAIAKYTNYKLLKQNKEYQPTGIDSYDLDSNLYELNYDLKDLLEKLLLEISEECKEILHLWAMKFRMVEIAEKLNYNSESYMKKKKHFCLKKLIAAVEKNPDLKKELRLYV